ncbi:LOW QUALITY PROTEIN: interferon regulatory factor 3 [Megalobrama amblycephala]|uniref:LOW QUALITY PROTEIN: interferon regulatory factor 3 n=1 Tax=Megalobrama amblycephala TaxID=75352 RepID=UPI002013D4D9|nr:LOW QUALITY PROTEIN: interferon regulatory factor 3 [Megalobrama amblycephala]
MTHPKPLFVPWLRQQIQSGQYPGVCWTNEELQQFSVPWKHALRQDSNSDDVLIFKAWAQTSAAGDGRINGDPSVWKRNFRSALRAKGFRMIFDNKNDAANPHKVYQFPSEGLSAGSEGSQETDLSPELYVEEENVFSTNPPQGLEGQFTGLNLQESPPQVYEVWNQDQFYLGFERQGLLQEMNPCKESPVYSDDQFQTVDTNGLFSSAGGAVGGLGQISPTEGTTAVNHHHSPAYQQPVVCQPHGEGDQVAVPEPKLETFFQIKVYYKGRMVLDQLVENDVGFRLMYQGDESSADLPVVTLPCPEDILDQIQAKHTNDILENLGGLEIRRLDGVVYGHRWGSSRIYWGLCKHEQSQTARELSKNTPEPVYFFRNYISGLMEFMQQTGSKSPSYSLYFFLGEKWPDPKMKPWEKKLIMIEVILTSLEYFKMMAVANGASSLQSVELQLSLEQMMELCDTK